MSAALSIALAAVAAYLLRTVSIPGAVAGWAIATVLYQAAGWRGLLLLALLLVVAAGSTRFGFERKRAAGIEQSTGGRRTSLQVIANTVVGLLFAVLARTTPMAPQCSVAMVAAFATAACDTVSSELGKACGGSTRLVTTLARVRPGTPGGVSGAGTLGGLAAAALLALAACGLDLVRGFDIPIVVAAAVAGALCESCLRATLLRDRSLGSLANLINTTIGALLAFGMHTLLDAR